VFRLASIVDAIGPKRNESRLFERTVSPQWSSKVEEDVMSPMRTDQPTRQFPDLHQTTVLAICGGGYDVALGDATGGHARIVRTVTIDDVAPQDMAPPETRLVWIGIAGPLDDQWNDWIADRIAADPAKAYIVDAIGDAAIDSAWASFGSSRCTVLADADGVDRHIALQSAITDLAPAAFDSRGESQPSELDRLREEVGRIAHALSRLTRCEADRMLAQRPGAAALAGRDAASGWPVDGGTHGVADDRHGYGYQPTLHPHGQGGVTSLEIRKMIRMRRLRDKHFDAALFSDPAWDMLLDLMAARIDRRPVSVSSLCIAAAVPATTALRWIKTMTETGLFERRSDPHDGRRVFIALSDQAAKGLDAYFTDVRAVGSLLPV